MGESSLTWRLASEEALLRSAGALAARWRAAGIDRLLVGLKGELGAGKTAWVRGMLRGLGYLAPVPSPTYTLMEIYELDGLRVVHLDLYRLERADELENLGVRDWLAEPSVWVLAEWPERAAPLERQCDLTLLLEHEGESARRLTLTAASQRGAEALRLQG